MSRLLLVVFLAALLAAPRPASGAPEAGKEEARDALALLVARGLVGGGPDGTFKGDRAASRWEVATLLARLLERMEAGALQEADRSALGEVRRLAAGFPRELEALGVRIFSLEDSTRLLERRVTERERLVFYGSVEARMTSQSLANRGASDNDNGRRGGGLPGGVPYADYETAVGTGLLANVRPQMYGVLPTVSYLRGRPLTSGTGLAVRTGLGLRLRISPELDGEAEFASYTSAGDRAVASYWGVYPPFLSNPFTADVGALQPHSNQPHTRLTLDHLAVRHAPSGTRVLLGALDRLWIDPLVYSGQPNLGAYGPARVPGFGLQVQGETRVGSDSVLRWEALGSRIGSNNLVAGMDYQHQVLAADLAWEFDGPGGLVKLNFARAFDEAPTGQPLLVGLIGGANVAYGNSTGWSTVQWVNPPGFFAAQRPEAEQVRSGRIPNTVDTRPIPGWNGAADHAVGMSAGTGGNFGPEAQDVWGIQLRRAWTLEGGTTLQARVEAAWSDYQSNRNSPYTSRGNALRVELGATLGDGAGDVQGWMLSVAPTYNPALFSGNVLGNRHPRTWLFAGRFHLYDSQTYPQNREGVGLSTRWKLDGGRGELVGRASWLGQTRSSLYDVRALPGSAGMGAPNAPVLGFAPGFIDPIFGGYAHPFQYGANSASSFTDALEPLEDPRGRVTDWFAGGTWKWEKPRVKIEVGYGQTRFRRASSLPAGFGGSQNHVDLRTDGLRLAVTWDLDDRWTLLGGVDRTGARGHHDPAGLFNAYAVARGSTAFTNHDSVQTAPYLGVSHRLARDTSWDFTLTRYDTVDRVPGSVAGGRALDTVGATLHPFSWDGWQGQFHVQFKF